MTRMVQCAVLKHEAEALDEVPHPGELGLRIYNQVSKEGWQQWMERLQMIINENGLNSGDPRSQDVIEQHMLGFFSTKAIWAACRRVSALVAAKNKA